MTSTASHSHTDPAKRKVAVVHDFLYCYAGAERVLEQILRLYPQADLFSLFDFLEDSQRGFLCGRKARTSFLQTAPLAKTHHRTYLPLMPLAIEQLDVSEYDLVISSSYVVAKGVLTGPDQLHVCYCHSPARYAWDLHHQYLSEAGLTSGFKSYLARIILHYLRAWDAGSANNVDAFVCNSQAVARRVRKFYRRESTVVHPPVDTDHFVPGGDRGDYYLTASRLVPYKRINLIVEAFSRTPNRKLVVIGEGPDFKKISALAGPNVQMLGYQPADVLLQHMQQARAFVFAAEEDFGIVPLEAQACGTPVIGLARGGLLETVIPDETGLFFSEQTSESLLEAVDEFDRHAAWDVAAIRASAQRFSIERFHQNFSTVLEEHWRAFHQRRIRPTREKFPDPADLDLAPSDEPQPAPIDAIHD
jgi:glycosyltransferase involved in cell wall biosynthesis